MELNDIYIKISRIFDSSYYHMVINPDHPFIFDTPNIMIGFNGNLMGIFIPKKSEEADYDKLLVRLSLSRLALPGNMKCILVIDKSLSSNYALKRAADNFHSIVFEDNLEDLKVILEDNNMLRNINDIPRHIREKVFYRSQIFWNQSKKLLNKQNIKDKNNLFVDLNKKPDEVDVTSWVDYDKKKRIAKNVFRIDNNIVASRDLTRKASYYNQIKNLFDLGVMKDFTMDTGVPYYHAQELKFMNVNAVPLMSIDPLKILRASSFAGWIITNFEDYNELELMSERILNKYEKRL